MLFLLCNTFAIDCPKWLPEYSYGDDYYDSIIKREDCRDTEEVSKWVMDAPSVCQLACMGDQACAGFTFVEKAGFCRLYNFTGQKVGVKKTGQMSGLRDSCVTGICIRFLETIISDYLSLK